MTHYDRSDGKQGTTLKLGLLQYEHSSSLGQPHSEGSARAPPAQAGEILKASHSRHQSDTVMLDHGAKRPKP